MQTINCPNCGKLLSEAKDDTYYCSNCLNHFELQEEDSSLEENDFEDDLSDESEDDEDGVLAQSEAYANSAIAELIKGIIKKFDHYGVSAEQLVVLCSIYKVLVDTKKYRVNGYLQITLKAFADTNNFTFQEITIDADGLRLTKGGYTHDDDIGGDTYSDEIFPLEDELDAISTVEVIDTFISNFEDKLTSGRREFDAFDSGDGIDELC